MTLQERYDKLCATPTAINEHLEILRGYASGCEYIAEFGVDTGQSTTAFLMAQPVFLISLDLVVVPGLDDLFSSADEISHRYGCPIECYFGRTRWLFGLEDSRTTRIPSVDLLFIDSAHSYEQMSVELSRHAGQVRKMIICHDTVSFGEFSEAGPPNIGILPAITEFLAANPAWRESAHYLNNNGLLVMERVNAI